MAGKIIETKICKQCGISFDITDLDIAFYDKVSPIFAGKKYKIPTPTFCPECRQQRRLNTRNERKLYHRKCDATGKQIISIYSEDKPYKIYDQEFRRGDKWDGIEYGRDIDFTKPFFQQFEELMHQVPRISMVNNQAENSGFCNQTTGMKDSYLCFNATFSEDCFYDKGLSRCKETVDSLRVYDCERCYECIDCHNCHACFYARECTDCKYCYMAKDCIGCEFCFGCVGLRNKKYHIFNKEYSYEEYKKITEFWKKPENKSNLQKEFEKTNLQTPKQYATIVLSENCTGDSIHSSKNANDCYDVVGSENVKYCYDLRATNKESYDIASIGDGVEYSYETCSCGLGFSHGLFDVNCRTNVKNIYYCDTCVHGCSDCFGCVGLRGKQYYILNKQYNKEEYEKNVAKLIEYMQTTGERGEYFPMSVSPFAYNETNAQEYFPLTKEQILAKGYIWKDEEDKNFKGQAYEPLTIEGYNPEKVGKVMAEKNSKELLSGILRCEVSGRAFRIIQQELEFYIRNNIPIPTKHPDVRHMERLNLRNPRKLRDRKCMKCSVPIKTTYAPEKPEIVYCENCYNKEIYG